LPEELAQELGGTTEAGVRQLIDVQAIFGLVTADGIMRIPESQFTRDEQGRLEVPPMLPGLLARWNPETMNDGWTFYGCLVEPQPALNGKSIMDCVKNVEQLETVAFLMDQVVEFSRRPEPAKYATLVE
jgi:hypothetical protein